MGLWGWLTPKDALRGVVDELHSLRLVVEELTEAVRLLAPGTTPWTAPADPSLPTEAAVLQQSDEDFARLEALEREHSGRGMDLPLDYDLEGDDATTTWGRGA